MEGRPTSSARRRTCASSWCPRSTPAPRRSPTRSINPAIGLGTFLAQFFLRKPLIAGRHARVPRHRPVGRSEGRARRAHARPSRCRRRRRPRPPRRAAAHALSEMPHEDRRHADGLDARASSATSTPRARLIAEAAARRRRAGRAARVLLLDGPARHRQARDRRGARRRADPAHARRRGARARRLADRRHAAARRAGDAERVLQRQLRLSRPTARCVARYDKIHLFRYDNGRERYDEGARARGRQRRRSAFEAGGAARRPERLLRPALSRAVPRADAAAVRPALRCRRRSPTRPARRTGSCCCAPARSRTSAT